MLKLCRRNKSFATRATVTVLMLMIGGISCERRRPYAAGIERNSPQLVLSQLAQRLRALDEQVKTIEVLYYPLDSYAQIDLTPNRFEKIATFRILIRAEACSSLELALRNTRLGPPPINPGDMRWRLRIVLLEDPQPFDVFVAKGGYSGYVNHLPVTFSSDLPDWLRSETSGLQ